MILLLRCSSVPNLAHASFVGYTTRSTRMSIFKSPARLKICSVYVGLKLNATISLSCRVNDMHCGIGTSFTLSVIMMNFHYVDENKMISPFINCDIRLLWENQNSLY